MMVQSEMWHKFHDCKQLLRATVVTVVMGYRGFCMDSRRTLFPLLGLSALVGLVILLDVE